jgi:hypothetical protein
MVVAASVMPGCPLLTALLHLIEQAAIGLNQKLHRIVIDTRSTRPARHGQETVLYESESDHVRPQ